MYYKDIFVIVLVIVISVIVFTVIYPYVKRYSEQQKKNALSQLHKKNLNYNRYINKLHYDNYIKHLNDLKRKENTNKVLQTYMDPPEFVKLNNLLFEFTLYNKWDNIIAIGDIYKNGAYPRFKRDKETALECYKIAARCPDSEVSGMAQLKYIETMSENNIDINDDMGDDIPKYYAHDVCNIANGIINNTPLNNFNRPKNKQNHNVENDTTLTRLTRPPNRTTVRNRIPTNTNINYTYKTDLQNVHDHSVTNIIKKNLDILKKTSNSDDGSNGDSENSTKNDVLYSILENPNLSDSVKGSVVIVLDNLNKVDKHGTYDVTEEEALALVWNKVKNEKDDIKKSNMIEILAKQLDSGIENGHVVCSSGKIARIIGTLDGIDDTITASRPIWAIKEEIGTLAGKIMNGNYKNPQDEFKKAVQQTYVDELKLDSNIITPIINEYIEYL